jgi:glycosyltransferase involved in cell wall biosynthesis
VLRPPIGYVVQTFPLVSETFVENEVRTVREQGIDVVLASLQRPMEGREAPTVLPPERLTYRPPPRRRRVEILRWFLRRPIASTANILTALRNRSETMLRGCGDAAWIATVFERAHVEQIHAHFATEGAAVAMATARLLDVPFTFTAHAVDLYKRTAGLCSKSAAAARVVTVCDYNIEQLLARCPALTRDRIELVYCGVDTDEFTLREELPPDDGVLRVLSVGRLVPKKGFDDLIRAVALARRRSVSIELDIIGEGHQRAELAALVAELGVTESVRLLGLQPNARVREALVATDVFALACVVDASRDRDSMPVVIKEAMAVGVPIVATDEVGIPEMVDARVGRLIPPANPEKLAEALIELAAMPAAERRALGLAARARAVERFDLRQETAKLAALFDAVREGTG